MSNFITQSHSSEVLNVYISSMKREPISYYLKNPSKLLELSVSQIEKWLQESPYSQPLRTLLAKRMYYNQEVTLDPVIAGASASASNRTWLYRELYEKVEYKTHTTEHPSATNTIEEIDTTIETTIHNETPMAVANAETLETSPSIEAETPEVDTEENLVLDQLVDYEEVTSTIASNKDTESTDVEEITDNSVDTKSELSEEIPIHQELESPKNLVDTKDESPSLERDEISIDPLPTKEPEELIPTLATINKAVTTPKLIDLNQSKPEHELKSIAEIQVVRVETDEEFIAGRDDDKKKEKKKLKKKSKKKDKSKKKKKSSKKADKKDKEKKKKKKPSKKKSTDKKSKDSKNLKLHISLDENIETSTTDIGKEKVKQKKKPKKKKSKLELLKYDIPVNPSEEKANHFDHDTGDMSNYAQWLLQFGSGESDNSFNNMTIAKSSSSNRIEDISFSSTGAKKKNKKNKKGKKKTASKAKNKSITDHSLEANEEIISELWADLLAKQGHIKKARKMYLKLSLKYPEKSSYFAAKLDNL